MSNTVFDLNGTTLTVKPVGELDSMTSPVFDKELRQHLSGVSSVIVDFEKLDYISSAGLRVLLALEQFMENHNGEMKIIHVNEPIMEIFTLTGFQDLITVE